MGKLWLVKDCEGIWLWRTKPSLEDGCWWEESEDYDEVTEDIYYSLTNYRDLPEFDELIEIEVNVISKDSSKENIKRKKHK